MTAGQSLGAVRRAPNVRAAGGSTSPAGRSDSTITARLAELETVIERGMQTFLEVGNALMEIRDQRLYRETHATFEAYCRERWGWTRQHANRQIQAARMAEVLEPMGPIPENERQARAILESLPPEERAQVRDGVVPEKLHWQHIYLSESNEWYTPAKYIESARAVMGGIDVDPASNPQANETVRASVFYTLTDNGLAHDWPGRVWLNPPYGGDQVQFVARLVDQFTDGITTEAVVLVNAHATETTWFAPLWDYPLCFTDHRINFYGRDGIRSTGCTHGSVFVYLGNRGAEFIREFDQWGYCVQRVRP
jgi:ParB family chromosome partitioning protein